MVGTSKGRGIAFLGSEGWIFVMIHGGDLYASDNSLITPEILGNHDASRSSSASSFGNDAADLKPQPPGTTRRTSSRP